MEIVNVNNREYDLNAIINFMDEDICVSIKNEFPFFSSQEFVDEYCKRHLNKYSQEFSIKNVLKMMLMKRFKGKQGH